MPQRIRAKALLLVLIESLVLMAVSLSGSTAVSAASTAADGTETDAAVTVASESAGSAGAALVATSEATVGSAGAAQAVNADVPSWVNKIHLKGDFRLRYQYQKKGEGDPRNRTRIRFRLAGKAKVADKWKVGFRFATGGDDPRSTNQTLDGSFSTPDFRLDYAYVMYSPNERMSLWGGKFGGIKHAIFRPTDLLWDSDLNPEGAGAILKGKFESVEVFGNLAWWILDEDKHGSDPMMFAVQPGIKVSIGESAHIKAAVAYYPTRALKGRILKHSAGTNSVAQFISEGDTTIGLAYDFNTFAPSFELGLNDLFDGSLETLSIFGDYVQNIDADSLNTGYSFGVKFGHKKVSKAGKWQVKYIYRMLETDAWLDIFPDSDAFGGGTGVQGSEAIFEIGLARNAVLGLDYYHMETIAGGVTENLLQVDTIFKF